MIKLRKVLWNLALALSIFMALSCGSDIANRHSAGENIICFGDSITQGVGAQPGEDFPSLLAKKLTQPVINAGIEGETTRDALARLSTDVLEKNPKLVIVEFGGNDYLQKIPKEETLQNLDKLVEAIVAQGAMVVLAQVKTGLLFDDYYKGFKRIAKKHKVLLIPDIMKGILTDPRLKNDYIHPNKNGYEIITERIYSRIAPLLR